MTSITTPICDAPEYQLAQRVLKAWEACPVDDNGFGETVALARAYLAMVEWHQSAGVPTSDQLERERDAAMDLAKARLQELDEARRLIKNLAPTGRYNGLDIESWYQRAIKAESLVSATAPAMRKCDCYVLPHDPGCSIFVGITQSGERVEERRSGKDRRSPAIGERTASNLLKMLREQRDGLADLLREIHERGLVTEANVEERIRLALKKVPTYAQQLRNVSDGLGMPYEELMKAFSGTADSCAAPKPPFKFEERCPDGQKCGAITTGCLSGKCQRMPLNAPPSTRSKV